MHTELLSWLIVGHLVGDFLLQTSWMAQNKAKKLSALLSHSLVYTASVIVFSLPADGLRWYSGLIIFITHALIDRRFIVRWWCRYITGSEDITWLSYATDQSFHLALLAIVCVLQMYLVF